MFEFLKGELARKSPTEVVVDVHGVGYLLSISAQAFAALPARGAVQLLVHVHATDAGTRLFGFLDERERALFRLLLTVSGVGPAVAQNLLSHEPPDALAGRLRAGDVKGLTRIKGIGTKTAERLVLELKDKVATGLAPAVADGHEELLAQALRSLGLDAGEAAERARAVVDAHPGEQRVEQLLRVALKSRSAGR
ncbi:MAG: Holliday junction branch migration protein RuvA [Planctomycetes bacterium]|nr:Holliday junction branch migration protein RuvA [Planctomycetota bacterium]